MARYILRLVGTSAYLKTVNGNVMIQTTNDTNKAKVYSSGMLEEYRVSITEQVRNEFNSKVEVVRIL